MLLPAVTRHEFLHGKFVVTGPLGHFQKLVHGGQLLKLLVQKPGQEILGDVVALGGGQIHEVVDGLVDC